MQREPVFESHGLPYYYVRDDIGQTSQRVTTYFHVTRFPERKGSTRRNGYMQMIERCECIGCSRIPSPGEDIREMYTINAINLPVGTGVTLTSAKEGNRGCMAFLIRRYSRPGRLQIIPGMEDGKPTITKNDLENLLLKVEEEGILQMDSM